MDEGAQRQLQERSSKSSIASSTSRSASNGSTIVMTRSFFILCLLAAILLACKQKKPLPDPLEAGWQGEQVCEVLFESKEMRVLKCTFPPNVGHEKHQHDPHFGYALAGATFQITDTTGVREVTVTTGTSFDNAETTIHEVLNISDSTGVFLIVEPKLE